MTKPFKNIEEQITLLKGRGLIIPDEDKAKHHLMMYNYYNVINCYSKYLQQSDNVYIAGSTFDEIAAIHYFDEEIKSVMFKYLIEIEKHLKSTISHIYSKHHQDNYSYLYASNYRNDNLLKVANLVAELAKIIKSKSDKKLPPNAIKHYQNQHNNIPLWVLSNYMSLGQTITFYQCMNDSEQNEVAKEFSRFLTENLGSTCTSRLNKDDLNSILNNVWEIRNIIAHNNKLLGFNCRKHIKYIPDLHNTYSILPSDNRQNVYNVFISMQALLSYNQFAQLHNTLLKRTKTLNKNLKSISSNIVTSSLGFPNDWHLSLKKPQI